MRFSEAIARCMNGEKITRKDWNGKGMYVWFVPPHKVDVIHWKLSVPTKAGPTEKEIEKGYVELASQTDMASDQWEVIE